MPAGPLRAFDRHRRPDRREQHRVQVCATQDREGIRAGEQVRHRGQHVETRRGRQCFGGFAAEPEHRRQRQPPGEGPHPASVPAVGLGEREDDSEITQRLR